MTSRVSVEPAPGPLEDYAARFDDLFANRAQREGFRRYLEGLLMPEERNKTLTALANTEPMLGAQHKKAQSLQWFLTESGWDPEQVNRRRVELLLENPQTAPTGSGALVIDETGDRKYGKATAHVGKQYLGGIGKIDNGVVSVSSLYADERLHYPLEVEPYTPAHHFEGGKGDLEFRTKPRIALEVVQRAVEMEIPFRAVVADILYGEHRGFRDGLWQRGIPYVLALKPTHAWWHRVEELGCVEEVARAASWEGEDEPGRWVALKRTFRDGHTERWWTLEAECAPYGPDRPERLVVTTTDPAELPELTTYYLITNLPASDTERALHDELAPAGLAEITRLYSLRNWIEQSYKQVKNSLGWAEYQVRKDLSIRRHWQLVCCAFSFCWWAWRTQERSEGAEIGSPPTVTFKEDTEQPSAGTDGASGEKKKDRPRTMYVVAADSTEGALVA